MIHLILFASVLVASPAAALECDGSPDLCQELVALRDRVKSAEFKANDLQHEKDLILNDSAAKVDRAIQESGSNTAKMAAMAGAIAVFLRSVLSLLQSVEKIPNTPRGKAFMKLSTLVVGLLIFVASNLGAGIPWWQALILAGGGPGAILINELAKTWPVLLNKPEVNQGVDSVPS